MPQQSASGDPAGAAASWHRFLDHTSEVMLEVGAPSMGELAAEAGRALARLLLRESGEGSEEPAVPRADALVGPQAEARLIEVTSADREALLVDWLNELLFVAETELWVPLDFDVLESSDFRLRMSVRGVAVDRAPSAIKAATFHGLHVVEDARGLTATVVLDA